MSPGAAPVKVRRATVRDAGGIAALLRMAFEPYRAFYTPAAYAATTPATAAVRDRLRQGPAWVAVVGDRAVGTLAAIPRPDGLYLRSMAVDPRVQRQGVGRALLAAAERHGRSHGHARLLLSSTPFLAPALRLYEAAGFAPSPEGPADLEGTPLVSLSKALAAVA